MKVRVQGQPADAMRCVEQTISYYIGRMSGVTSLSLHLRTVRQPWAIPYRLQMSSRFIDGGN